MYEKFALIVSRNKQTYYYVQMLNLKIVWCKNINQKVMYKVPMVFMLDGNSEIVAQVRSKREWERGWEITR